MLKRTLTPKFALPLLVKATLTWMPAITSMPFLDNHPLKCKAWLGKFPLLAKALCLRQFFLFGQMPSFVQCPPFGPILLFWPMHSFGHCFPLLANVPLSWPMFHSFGRLPSFWPMPSFGKFLFWPLFFSLGHCFPLLATVPLLASALFWPIVVLASALFWPILFWPVPSFWPMLFWPILVVVLVEQLVTSQPVAVDRSVTFLLTHRRLGPKSDIVKTARIIHSAQRTFTRFAWFPILALQRSRLSWNCGIDLFLVLRYWDIEWRWHLLKKLRC